MSASLMLPGCKGKPEPPPDEEVDSYKTLANLGLSLFGQQKFNEAATYWEKALIKDPKNPKNSIICNNLFIIYFQQRKYADCQRVIDAGLSIEPNNPALLNKKGMLLKMNLKYDEALEVLLQAEKALETHNLKDYFPIGNLADVYRLKKEYPEAVKILQKYIKKAEKEGEQKEEINATVGFLYHHLGMVRADQKRLKQAIDLWMKALEMAPDQDITHYQIALAYEKLGDVDKAIEYYKNVLRINPNHVFGLNNLGYLYAGKGKNLTEAEKMINRAIALDPSAKSITLDSLAWVHYKMERYDQALTEVTQAIELAEQLYKTAKENPEIEESPEYANTLADYYYHKGEIEIALNKKNEAKISFKESKKFNPKHEESAKALKQIK
jgi:tetratricopeptide (TPR) repeat protein